MAWFAERTGEDLPCEPDTERFVHHYLSEVGYGELFRSLRADSEAVVILGGWSSPMTIRTLLMTSILRIPVFIWADHPHPRKRSWLKDRSRKTYLRFLSIIAKGFLACGRPTAKHLESLGIAPRKITNFPYWVEVPEAWSLPERCAHTTGEPLRLLAIGRHVALKQFEVAIAAIAQVNSDGERQAELLLAGDGPCRAQLEDLTISLECKDAVRFAGWLTNTDVFNELKRADALALTSRFDAYGVVVLEAMAVGRTVLASDGVIAALDRNEGEAIFLHANGKADELANQIRALASDSEMLRRASIAARSAAEKWMPERAAAILDDLLTRTRRGSMLLKRTRAKGVHAEPAGSAAESSLAVEG